MAAFSNYLEDQITGWLNGTTFVAAPVNTYLQLYNGDPTDTGTGGTQVLSRVAVPSGSWTRGTGGAGTITNTSQITVTSNASVNATATHAALFSASTGGNMYFYGALTTSAAISAGDEVKISASNLSITIA